MVRYTLLPKSRPKQIKWVKDGDCFRCTSHTVGATGYPHISRFARQTTIPRLILKRRGQDLPGIVARHTCDNRWCIRPDHIVAGSQGENVRDAATRGRLFDGEKCSFAKLTESEVKQIRNAVDVSDRDLASWFAVHPDTIRLIKQRKTWKRLNMKILPENYLKCMSAQDRQKLGKAGLTKEEAILKAEIKSESDLQKQIVALLNLKGIEVNVSRMDKRKTDRVGWPDLTFGVFCRHDCTGAAIRWPCAWEIKLPGKEPTSQQAAMLMKLQKDPNDWRVAIIHSLGEARRELTLMGIGG